MSSRLVIEVKTYGWSVTVRPFSFENSITFGGKDRDIHIPGCPQEVSLAITAASHSLHFDLKSAAFRENTANEFSCNTDISQHLHIMLEQEDRELFSIVVHQEATPQVPDYRHAYNVPEDRVITVGTEASADIQVCHGLHKGEIITLERHGSFWTIVARNDTALGIYLNTKKITGRASARAGDFVSAQGLHLYLQEEGILLASNDDVRIRTLSMVGEREQVETLEYPCVTRTSRLAAQVPVEPIHVQDPSPVPSENKSNLLISLLPAVSMMLLTFLLRGSYSSNSHMILFSVVSLSVGAVTSVLTYFQTGRDMRKKREKRKADYEQYIAESEARIRKAREKEKQIFRELYVDVETEVDRVKRFSATMFDRCMEERDFLDIRLGYGRMRSGQPVTCASHEVYETTDELFAMPEMLQKRYEFSDGMPAFIRGKTANAAGFVGDYHQLQQLMNVMVLDLAVRQYFEDVQMYFLLNDRFSDELHALRLLPHVQNRETGRRSIAYHDESRTVLLESLFKTLSERGSSRDAVKGMPWLVVFADADDSAMMRHPVMQFVARASDLHVLFLFLATHKDMIPQGCTSLVRLMNNVNMGLISSFVVSEPDKLFSYDPVDNKTMVQLCTRLAPVYSSEVSLTSRLKGNESLFDMLGIHSVEELDVLSNWRRADTTHSLGAPLGILEDGSCLYLDLHESAHGSHGLVAGMTGSGKSQVLISYILSLASRYSPEDVAFAVIDFKGGDIVKQLPGLPHIVGSITNLDKGEIERSLRSINAEKNKRMVLFDEDHANVSNITEYTQAYKAGKTSIPLPHLVIIVDEFAELKSQYFDFMQDLISIARVGRSLGIHLILCTQKPAGIVDAQIWSNSNFHVCLKVQSKEDSNEVLHSPLAAEIREPGRGYLQVEHQMLELFQSGYSGHPETIGDLQETPFSVYRLDLSGKPETIYSYAPVSRSSSRSQREALLESIKQAFSASGMAVPVQLCQPPLPQNLPYDEAVSAEGCSAIVGILDDPDAQMIQPLALELAGRNTLIIGSGQMGKTNLLLTLLRQLSKHMSVRDVNVYAMDFNAKAIKTMENIDLIGGVLVEDEEEKLRSLLKMLRQEVAQRKTVFAQNKITSYTAYREMQNDLPAIVVLIDNYAVFRELYEDKYGDELLYLLREGPAYGVSFVVTAQQISTLSYKKPFYFTQRVLLPVSDASEYMAVLDGCRCTLREIPGRVLVQQGRQFYEGQIFEAFNGKTEFRRVEAMKEFIAANSGGQKAKPIPCVPSTLTLQYLRENFPGDFGNGRYPYAMEYDNVAPVAVNINTSSSISLVGGNEERRNRLLIQLISQMIGAGRRIGAELYIFDGFYRPLKQFKGHPAVKIYSNTAEMLDAFFERMIDLKEQRSDVSMNERDALLPVIVVVNSYEVIKAISDNMMLMEQFNNLIEQYRRMKCFFIFSDLPNKPVRFSSPDLLKFISEEKQGVIMCDLNEIQIYDIPLSVMHKHGRSAAPDEGFLIGGDDISRIKMCEH